MKARGVLLTAGAVLICVIAILAMRARHLPSSPSQPPPQAFSSPPPAPVNANANSVRPPVSSPTQSSAAPSPEIPPAPPRAVTTTPQQSQPAIPDGRAQAMVELEKVHRMIDSYHTLMGQNPVGTNAEIMKALLGGNPHQAVLGPPPGQSLNAKGELIDAWGTPYFFHQLSGDHMEIHSAGPDKIMGTADDVVMP